jgi:hypothetical protein
MVNAQNNNNETVIFSIENSSNRELGQQLRTEIDSIANHFISLDDKEKTIKREKKSLILELADKFERLHEINEFPLPISMIGSALYRYLQRKGFDITDRYVHQVLHDNAPHYLNNSYQDLNSSGIDIKIKQDQVMEAIHLLKNQNWKLMKRDQMQDIYSSAFDILDSVQDYTEANNILVNNLKDEEYVPHYDSEELDPFRDAVITDKGEYRESNFSMAGLELGKAIVDFGNTIIANAKMSMDYPPDEIDKEAEIYAVKRMFEWRDWWLALSQAMKGGTDRKYRRSIVQWVKIAEDENDWGKHAASSKNPYTARFRDPKTGEWREEIRKLTREQIGDKSPKVREFVSMMRKTVPACLDFVRWSELYLHPFTNGESVKLSGKLSDRSLR